MPVEELAEGTGHWIWQSDAGTRRLIEETSGQGSSFLQQAFAPHPEHWFTIREDGKWAVRIVTGSTGSSGEVEVLDVGGKAQEGTVMLRGEEVLGSTRSYVEADKLVIEWRAKTSSGEAVELKNEKVVVQGLYHSTVEDSTRNLRATRIFRRFPSYKIDNQTGESITLKTFLRSDFFYLVPAMTVKVRPGTHYMEASSGERDEEQAVFSLEDGRDLTCLIKAFQTITLKAEDFRQYPYYKIENLTGETVTLTTFSLTDFLYLVPAMTVELREGLSHVTSSSRETKEEQAIFTLFDGRSCRGKFLKAFQVIKLKREDFKQHPYYKIENLTGDTVTLTTYLPRDFLYLVPAMVADIPPGTSKVHASAGDIEEEQASFSMHDGRTFSGFNIKGFNTVVLKQEFFS